jgi:hypothetical protein
MFSWVISLRAMDEVAAAKRPGEDAAFLPDARRIG